MEISPELARTLIEEGAQELILFPIYEEKEILVKNATPSKEDFNVMMQIFASYCVSG